MKKIIFIIICLSATYAVRSQNMNTTITINNIKSNKGIIRVSLFNNEKGFPEKSNLAVKSLTFNAIKGSMSVKIDGITLGKDAIAIHHDENNDSSVNTNFFGIPTESTGVSNGAKGKFGPPKYSDAVITLTKEVSINIE